MTRRYRFELVCPRCGKIGKTISDKRIPPPTVNCGDCLMERAEIVAFKVIRAEERP
jgi:hypothetical protein